MKELKIGYDPAVQVNSQTLKLLLVHDGFLRDVKNIRKKYGIPKIGFRSNKAYQSWWEGLRAKSDADVQGYDGISTISWWRDQKMLRQKYDLGEHFRDVIMFYVVENKMGRGPRNWVLRPDREKREVVLVFYGPVAQDVLSELTAFVADLGDHHHSNFWPNYQTQPEFDRNLEIYKRFYGINAPDGKRQTLGEIALEMSDDEEVPLEELGDHEKRTIDKFKKAKNSIKRELKRRFPGETFVN